MTDHARSHANPDGTVTCRCGQTFTDVETHDAHKTIEDAATRAKLADQPASPWADQDNDPQTAMMLTQTEWEDLSELCTDFLRESDWVDRRSAQYAFPEDSPIHRRRRLARRIIEAAK